MHLAIYGEGGTGHEALELTMHILNANNERLDSIFFVVDGSNKKEYMSHPIFSFEETCRRFTPEMVEFVIALGEPADRMRLYDRVKSRGYGFRTLIHPITNVSPSAAIGEGTTIQSYAGVSGDTKIGDNCLIQGMSSVGHNCVIGNHCVVSVHAVISGLVTIGDNSYIAPGVIVKDRVKIGSNTIVGIGSSVQRDIPDNVIALGNPARPMKYKDDSTVFKKE